MAAENKLRQPSETVKTIQKVVVTGVLGIMSVGLYPAVMVYEKLTGKPISPTGKDMRPDPDPEQEHEVKWG